MSILRSIICSTALTAALAVGAIVLPSVASAAPHEVIHQGIRNFGVPGFARTQPPRYEPRFFPREIHAPAQFHWRAEWAPPPGYAHRRWIYGERLPRAWLARRFWIVDYFDFDLPPPPIGFAWIRLGADALLVDLATGKVVEVVYGLFL